jgi:hypothetical protein
MASHSRAALLQVGGRALREIRAARAPLVARGPPKGCRGRPAWRDRLAGVANAPASPRTRARPRHDAKCATARATRGIRSIETLAGSRVPRELGETQEPAGATTRVLPTARSFRVSAPSTRGAGHVFEGSPVEIVRAMRTLAWPAASLPLPGCIEWARRERAKVPRRRDAGGSRERGGDGRRVRRRDAPGGARGPALMVRPRRSRAATLWPRRSEWKKLQPA